MADSGGFGSVGADQRDDSQGSNRSSDIGSYDGARTSLAVAGSRNNGSRASIALVVGALRPS